MAINKVVYNGGTLIDLTGDTVTADKLMQGYIAHDRSGAVITGTATGGEDGNFLEYGLTDGTSPLVGVAKISEAVLFETSPQIGTAQAGFTTVV